MCVPTSPAPPLDSLGGEEHKASVEEDHGEDDEERVAHSLLVCIVEHLTGLGGQQKGTQVGGRGRAPGGEGPRLKEKGSWDWALSPGVV